VQLDATRIETFMMMINALWDSWYQVRRVVALVSLFFSRGGHCPLRLQIIGYMVILGVFVGYAALAGLAGMILLFPIQVRDWWRDAGLESD
jgi:hypothetical protein